jgi:alpha-beta hydrolase superfamily lysophospholipase
MKMQPRTLAGVALSVAGLTTAAAGALVGAVSMVASHRVTRPVLTQFDTPAPPEHLPREAVSLTSRDGTELAAWFIPGERREPILLLHGYGATKREMLHHAAFLNDGGYPVMLLDLRCCGESGGRAVTFGGREREDVAGEDVAAAITYLQERPDVDGERAGVLGLSLGGALALLAAAEFPAVRAVVAESSFANIRDVVRRNFRVATKLPSFLFAPLTIWLIERRWGIRASRVMPEREIGARDDCAVLLIHAENDRVVNVQDAHALFTAARGPKELWLIPDAAHAMAYLTEQAAYANRVRGFFDRWLPAGVERGDADAIPLDAAAG